MFESLDSIDWASLKGCYGPANEVPRLLRAMLSPIAEIRDAARQDFFAIVWHQGTIYEASPKVVPFLFELLENVDVKDKVHIAIELASLADSLPYLNCERTDPKNHELWRSMFAKEGKDFDREADRELEWVSETKKRVGQKLDVLLPYLRHKDPVVREYITRCLGNYPEKSSNLIALLRGRLQKESDGCMQKVTQEVIDRLSRRA